MACDSGNSSSLLGIQCLYVYTNASRNFVLLIHEDDNISKVKENICKEYTNLYSKIVDVKTSALKVKLHGCFFDLCDTLIMKKLFGPKDKWFLTAQFKKVKTSVEQNNTNTVVTEKPLEAAFRVDNTKTKKRRLKTADANNAASSEKVAKRRRRRSKKPVCDPIITKSKETDVVVAAAEHLPTENQTAEKTVASDTLESTANLQVAEASLETNQAGKENIGEGIAMDTVESTDNPSLANPAV